MPENRSSLAERCRVQAGFCRALGSPLYAELLERAARDALAGGPVWRVVEERAEAPADSAPLGLMGAVHRLVLEGRARELGRFYPSAALAAGRAPGGPRDPDAAWEAFRSVVEDQAAAIRSLLDRPIQTNEVGRCAALLGGFLAVARETGLPLRLVEIGASAGLNLRWDRYRYEAPDAGWGDPASPVRFREALEGPHPRFDVGVTVVERSGCDLSPVDPTAEEGRLTLMSYVWADQAERFARLIGALEIAREVPVELERAEALAWLPSRLGEPAPGAATVVFHSIVALYFSPQERDRLARTLAMAGDAATPAAPVAWLRMEHPDTGDPSARGWARLGAPEVRLTTWPGGEERLLAVSAAHGPPVRWLAG